MLTLPAGECYIRENGFGTIMIDPAALQLHCRGEYT
jgi:hypothetical protein